MKRILLIAILGILAGSCSLATWPDVCKLRDTQAGKMYLCRCEPNFREVILPHPDGKPKPAGRVVWVCGSQKLPIEVEADEIVLPK